MQIGVLGLGRMGHPIAAAIAKAHDVVAHDPDPARADARSAIRVVPTVSDAVGDVDAVITVLPGAREFAAAVAEIAGQLRPDAVWIDCTSNDPRLAQRAAAFAAARGAVFVGAPMSGGPEEARTGSLHFSLSGPSAAVARATGILALASAPDGITVVGDQPGDAHAIKLLSNMLWFGQVVAVTEVMLLGTDLGLQPERLHELLGEGPGASVMLTRDYGSALRGDYRPTFGIDRVVEELDILTSMAAERDVPFELSRMVASVHQQTLDRFGPIDGELLAAALLSERAHRPPSAPAQETTDGAMAEGGPTEAKPPSDR